MFNFLLFLSLFISISACGQTKAFLFRQIKENKSSEIFLNDSKTKVFFNDGDTLRVESGPFLNERVRIEGFNALESYGPVHSWASFNEHELYEIAKKATEFARSGGWHCKINQQRDTYGRLLGVCDDLAKNLIRNGLAHAYSADEEKANPEYLDEQKKAQQEKLGLWRKGVPQYIITSLHSADENAKNKNKNKKNTYNRLISAIDGHSKKWQHNDIYKTCQKVCIADVGSCLIYVPFEFRYGVDKAHCLLN